MAVYTLENQYLQVKVDAQGAEMVRLFDKKKERDVLWHADPEYWGRHAPVLFPFVGALADGRYRHKGITYPMGQHGFARDMAFSLKEEKEDEIWFSLTDTPRTREVYPFPFLLEIGYKLIKNKVEVLWRVTNTGAHKLFFNIGGHPAFVLPKGMEMANMHLVFPEKTALHYWHIEDPGSGCVLRGHLHTLPLEDGAVELNENFWSQGVYIFPMSQVEKVALQVNGKPYVSLKTKGFPFTGVWTKPGYPFICLEPWYGRADDKGFTGSLSEKPDIQKLEGGEVFSASYRIKVGE